MRNVLKVQMPVAYSAWRDLYPLGVIYPLRQFCIVAKRPKQVTLHNGLLHCTTGPAVLYADGFCVYALNGVQVSKELVETPAEALDPMLVCREQNAEIRREIVRKIGVERLISKIGAVCIDRSGDYELLIVDLGDGRKRPYLKMLNPSIGVWHVEGVHLDCQTVEAALNWRNDTKETPAALT
jgi:hypothetical protein